MARECELELEGASPASRPGWGGYLSTYWNPSLVAWSSLRAVPVLQVGYQPVAANFFFYSAIIFLLILISETLGMLCSGAFRAELTGAIVLQALYVPLLMFVGFFQVCDGASTCTCSCLEEIITCRPSACSPQV